jgi:hypothetical protein
LTVSVLSAPQVTLGYLKSTWEKLRSNFFGFFSPAWITVTEVPPAALVKEGFTALFYQTNLLPISLLPVLALTAFLCFFSQFLLSFFPLLSLTLCLSHLLTALSLLITSPLITPLLTATCVIPLPFPFSNHYIAIHMYGCCCPFLPFWIFAAPVYFNLTLMSTVPVTSGSKPVFWGGG